MSNEHFDNIPLLDDLIEKGDSTETVLTSDLETKINDILQRHTAQAVAEIVAIIDAKTNKTT